MNRWNLRQMFCFHSFSEWFIENEAKYKFCDRWETRVCTKCGKKQTRSGDALQLNKDDACGLPNLGVISSDLKLHQCYTNEGSTKKLICTKCGSIKFEVGQDEWFTSVRCCRCGQETEVHSG